jgi:ABC-type sugar transport system ATPase subunit
VALGRLLLARCDALLLDEPFASLDAALRRSLTALVKDLSSQRTVPSVLVTHQLSDAQAFADRLLVMDAGAIVQAGAPDQVVLRPASRRVAELVGYLGFVPVDDAAGAARAPGANADVAVSVPGVAGQSGAAGAAGVVAGVHPDRVLPGADPARGLVVTGSVTAARPSGAGWEADLLVGDAPFTCRLPSRLDGAQVSVTLLDPPYFGPDGALLGDATRPANPARGGPLRQIADNSKNPTGWPDRRTTPLQ